MRTASYFHCSLKPIKRSAGRSAVACAAYRTGTKLEDRYYGTSRDFSRKKDVVTSFTLAPDNAPQWATDAEQLWNAVEQKENRKNSQVAFEIEAAAPNELTDAERENLARDITAWLVSEYGVAVTVGIHNGGTRGNGLNDHFHIMMTTREIGPEGWGAKLREFSTKPGQKNPEVAKVREHVADLINNALEDAGSDERVDHRSYKTRGIDREPGKHLGPDAWALEQREGSDLGDANRATQQRNRELIESRLAWQAAEFEAQQAAFEITGDIERDLAARFEGWQPLARGASVQDAPVAEHGVDTESAPPVKRGTPADTSQARSGWRLFADRVRLFHAKALEFWNDEGSGNLDGAESWVARVAHAGKHLAGGWRHRNTAELAKGIAEGADLAAEAFGKFTSDQSGGGKNWTQRVRDGLHQVAGALRDQSGAGLGVGRSHPPDAFHPPDGADALAEEWEPFDHAARPEPPDRDTPPTEPDGPEPQPWDIEP